MADINDIPRGYSMTEKVNLRADAKIYRRWNLFSAIFGLGLIALGWLWRSFEPLRALFERGFSAYFLRALLLVLGLLLYAQCYSSRVRCFCGFSADRLRAGGGRDC